MPLVWIISTQQQVKPVITYWPGRVHDVVGIVGDPRILILDGSIPSGVSVVCRLVPGNLVLVSSVRPSGVPYGG